MITQYHLWLVNDRGDRLALLDDVVRFQWTRIANNVGTFFGVFPEKYDLELFAIDNRIEVWRAPAPGLKSRLENVYIIRRPLTIADLDGDIVYELYCPDVNELLKRRIIAYAAGTSQADKTDNADDMMKAIVRENLGASAGTDDFGASRSFDSDFFGVQVDAGLAPSISKAFSWRNVLIVLQDIAEAAYQAGTELYFAIVPSSPTYFEFQTYIDQPGQNRTKVDGTNPVSFGLNYGNIQAPVLEEDYEDEVNYVYGGGQGEGAARSIQDVRDLSRINASIWNRREGFRDARHEATDAGVSDEADIRLNEGRPKLRFMASLLSSENARYGLDWLFGDKVTVEFRKRQYNGIVKAVIGTVQEDGKETIEGKLEAEDVSN